MVPLRHSQITGQPLSFSGFPDQDQTSITRARGTILVVNAFLSFGSHLMIWLFLIGLAGSSVVIVISFVEDLTELLGD